MSALRIDVIGGCRSIPARSSPSCCATGPTPSPCSQSNRGGALRTAVRRAHLACAGGAGVYAVTTVP